jgi:hypothetical protein
VPRLSRIFAIVAMLLTSGEAISATEKFAFIWTADAVVVGQNKAFELLSFISTVYM